MRRLLPLALLLAACGKAAEPAAAPNAPEPIAPAPVDTAALTPEGMAKAMDVPLLPGATAPDGLSTAPHKDADGSTHYRLVLATSKPVDAAADFYAKALNLVAMPGMGGKNIIGKSPHGNDLVVTVAPEAGRTLVTIRSIAYGK